MPENADNKSVTWTSSNTEIATINQNGLVTAIKEGVATITVTTQDGGKTATCQVVVKPKPIEVAEIILTPTELTLTENGTATLTATISPENATNQAVTWASSNTEIATIDANGLVTAIKEGTATITATTQDGGKVATCIVNVEPAVPYITMVTQKNIGEDIRFIIKIANEADKANIWIDLNNNGKKDIDEDKVVFYDKDRTFSENYAPYRLQSQTITLYGKVTGLDCRKNQLTQLDVSKNTKLANLICFENQLTQLDVSKNTELSSLECYNNQLTQLDVSKNTQLEYLICSRNQLTQLDVSINTQLTSLSCEKNQLTQLDVSKNTKLVEVRCYENQLTQLDVSKNTKLAGLNCADNQLSLLDISRNTQLVSLNCANNQLTQLDVSKSTKLAGLNCANNQLTQLDISKNTQLVGLHCFQNSFTQLDISKNTQLTFMSCVSNKLSKEAIAKLLSDLRVINNGKERVGKAYIVGDASDKNYRHITEEQKQQAKNKNWRLYVNNNHINP